LGPSTSDGTRQDDRGDCEATEHGTNLIAGNEG
jgi:hypothetical protein